MPRCKLVIDCSLPPVEGEALVDFTPEEEAERDADEAAWAPVAAEAEACRTNEQTVRERAEVAFDLLGQDLVTLAGTPTNAQLVAILTRVVKVERGLLRLVLRKLDGAD